MDKIIGLDYFFTNFLNHLLPHNLFFNYFFSFFSLEGASILVWLIVIAISVLLEERKNPGISKRDKKFIVLFSLAFLLSWFSADIFLKNIFMRPRPLPDVALAKAGLLFSCPKDFSFPSAHAVTAFAAATVLIFFDKKRKWFYYSIAVLISFSRIYLGCHYFFDVVTGALIGYLISKLILKLSITLNS